MFKLDRHGITQVPTSAFHWQATCWAAMIHANGAADITIPAAAQEITDRLGGLLPGLWTAKGSPVDPKPLADLRVLDAEITLAKAGIEKAKERITDLQRKKNDCLDAGGGQSPETLVGAMSNWEAQIALAQKTIERLEAQAAEKIRIRPALLARFKATTSEVISAAVGKATREAHEEIAAAWVALEKAMSPCLDALAKARAKAEALQGSGLAQALQSRLDAMIEAPAPTQPIPAAKAG